MSSITCEFCFAQFTSSVSSGATTVQCPDCGEETSALADDAADVESYSLSTDDNSADDNTGEEESYGFASEDEDSYGFENLEVTGEAVTEDAPEVVPVRRKKKKTGKRKKKKKAAAQASTGSAAQIISLVVDILSGYPKVIGGILLWIVFMVLLKSGVFESREQKVFHNMTGESRTTGEWLQVVRNYEEQSADGQISMKAKSLYLKISDGMNVFLGADPAAIPDLFKALQEDPQQSQLPRLATAVLEKFKKTNTKADLSDLEDGLESEHPQVILWSVRLLAMHGTTASGYADRVAEFADSEDPDIVAAVGETLSQIR